MGVRTRSSRIRRGLAVMTGMATAVSKQLKSRLRIVSNPCLSFLLPAAGECDVWRLTRRFVPHLTSNVEVALDLATNVKLATSKEEQATARQVYILVECRNNWSLSLALVPVPLTGKVSDKRFLLWADFSVVSQRTSS